MDKTSIVESQDAKSLEQTIACHIERITALQREVARIEHEQSALIANGNGMAPALEIEEARLMSVVNSDPTNTNDAKRKAALAQLKAHDADFQAVARDVANLKLTLREKEIETAYLGQKFGLAMQSLKYKRAVLDFLADAD
jgi:hypothetical protein